MISFITNTSEKVDNSDIEFKPHSTVAYKDLTPDMSTEA